MFLPVYLTHLLQVRGLLVITDTLLSDNRHLHIVLDSATVTPEVTTEGAGREGESPDVSDRGDITGSTLWVVIGMCLLSLLSVHGAHCCVSLTTENVCLMLLF